MTKYIVLSPVEHNGEPYQIDSEIDLSDVFAQPLLEVGVIGAKPKATVAADKKKDAGKK